jgi:hypothetical protein
VVASLGGIGGAGRNGNKMLAPTITKRRPSRIRQMRIAIFIGHAPVESGLDEHITPERR